MQSPPPLLPGLAELAASCGSPRQSDHHPGLASLFLCWALVLVLWDSHPAGDCETIGSCQVCVCVLVSEPPAFVPVSHFPSPLPTRAFCPLVHRSWGEGGLSHPQPTPVWLPGRGGCPSLYLLMPGVSGWGTRGSLLFLEALGKALFCLWHSWWQPSCK